MKRTNEEPQRNQVGFLNRYLDELGVPTFTEDGHAMNVFGRAKQHIESLQAEVERLRAALAEAIPFVAEGIVDCRGDKCRQPNCRACSSDPRGPDWNIIHGASRE